MGRNVPLWHACPNEAVEKNVGIGSQKLVKQGSSNGQASKLKQI
jgi:hypothetical protein